MSRDERIIETFILHLQVYPTNPSLKEQIAKLSADDIVALVNEMGTLTQMLNEELNDRKNQG